MHLPLRRLLGATLAVLAGGALAVAAGTPADAGTPGTLHYAVSEPTCAQPSNPAAVRCFALKRKNVAAGTPGAVAYTLPAAVSRGPAGGYSPAALARAYGYDPSLDRHTTTVAAVLWGHYPTARADLDTFDAHYGLPAETATSFQQVSQRGGTDFPPADPSSAGEEALDIQAIRGVCHTCRILLVEADSYDDDDLAVAENYAAAHASVVSNSWGGSEYYSTSPALVRAFDHPGVAITASTGDSGWFNWDDTNHGQADGSTGRAANYPSTDPHVISVSGTTLRLTSSGTRASETVWNGDGHEAATVGTSTGVAGGGCSATYSAPAWQSRFPGYSAACHGKRLAADVSMLGDPDTGYDIYSPDGSGGSSWATYGGTSLSSPLLAGMIALAGGSHGVAFPAATIYANAQRHPSTVNDITSGGTGFCDGDSIARCSARSKTLFGKANPNTIVGRRVDCSWPDFKATSRPSVVSRECNAARGYDGASGVGTPRGLGLFAAVQPQVAVRVSSSALRARFSAAVAEPVAGISVRSTRWTFGDGSSSSSAAPAHAYRAAGTYRVTVSVTNSLNQRATHTASVTVGRKPVVQVHGASSVSVGRSHTYTVAGSRSANTGDHVATVSWRWGDGTRSAGGHATHAWSRPGRYTVRVTVVDTAGYGRATTRTVTVR